MYIWVSDIFEGDLLDRVTLCTGIDRAKYLDDFARTCDFVPFGLETVVSSVHRGSYPLLQVWMGRVDR